MGSKAFWIGLSVVLMSLISALATYLSSPTFPIEPGMMWW